MKTKYIFSGLMALTLVTSCSEKMDYKARFLPQERLGPKGWDRFEG